MRDTTLVGRLTSDLDIKYTKSGKMVGQFSIAITEKRASGDYTHFFDCVAWEKTCELMT